MSKAQKLTWIAFVDGNLHLPNTFTLDLGGITDRLTSPNPPGSAFVLRQKLLAVDY